MKTLTLSFGWMILMSCQGQLAEQRGVPGAVAWAQEDVPVEEVPVPVSSTPREQIPIETGSFEEGRTLGGRNGGILLGRVERSTVGRDGCESLGRLETAVVEISRSIEAPRADSSFVQGFYHGYLEEVHLKLKQVRERCGGAVSDGLTEGRVFGEVTCRVAERDRELALQLVLPSPEPGWAGGSVRVPRVCVDQALAVVDACDPSLSESAHTRLETSCRDSVISTVLD